MKKLSFENLADIPDLANPGILPCDIDGFNDGSYLREGAGDLVFLGGRPGSGKTLLAMQVAYVVSLYKPTIVFSLEMTKGQLKSRLVRGQKLSPNARLLICDEPGLHIDSIESHIREAAEGSDLGLVVIDYAQIVQQAGRNKAEEVGVVIRKLKGAAKDTGVSILLLAQLSRDIEKRTKEAEFAEPVMSDFADSAEIEKWADCCLIMHHTPKSAGVTRVHCVKNRHGECQDFDIRLDKTTLRFSDAAVESQTVKYEF